MKAKGAAAAAGVIGAATAAVMLANRSLVGRAPALWPAIDAPGAEYGWDGGRVRYARAGDGPALLLLHSHNAAASTYEVRQAFGELAADYTVYAPDLPGYGLSERRARPYTAETFIRFIHDFTRDVIGGPAALVALSLSAAHAMVAASEDPATFQSVVAISPTGLHEGNIAPPAIARGLGGLLRVPVWGFGLFHWIASERSIRSMLERSVYYSPWAVTHEMVRYAWVTSHQPSATYAPAAFLNGASWIDARAAYASLGPRVMTAWGDHDRLNPYAESEDALAANPEARTVVFPECAAMPQDEAPEAFAGAVRAFLEDRGTA